MLAGLSLPAMVLLLLAGVLLDLLLGETRRWHPLVGFGNLAGAIERRLNRGRRRFARGLLAWLAAVAPATALAAWICGSAGWPALAAHAVLLYFCIGLRSLREHNLPIGAALLQGQLAQARSLTARIVSRDTDRASAADLAKASAESLLENGNDAVFGTLFWFAVAGGPGAVLFRLANTLDAMWGYRNPRYTWFGCAAARIDDALNFIPARLTALSYVLLADGGARGRRRAWCCWRSQAPAWSSPNAGPVMSSGAGALGLALGGAASYDGVIEHRPPLGSGRAAAAHDIGRAWTLVARTTALWLACLGLVAALILLFGSTHA
ncbi:MAG: CobD/CbiB family cobalamin biosynthesis protein [Pseudomonadota bacterium]